MSSNWQKAGPNHVPSYQTSGIPYVTSSAADECKEAANTVAPVQITFPYVTKFVTVNNTGGNDLRVAFTFSGSYAPGQRTTDNTLMLDTHPKNYFVIQTQAAGSTTIASFDVRCKTMFFLGDGGTTDFSLIAGLTTIPSSNFPVLTGSLGQPGLVATGSFEGVG
jgi:hypothetical protein